MRVLDKSVKTIIHLRGGITMNGSGLGFNYLYYQDIAAFFGQSELALNMLYLWLSVAVIFLLLEVISAGTQFFFPFSFGGMAAALAAWFDYSATTQSLVFLGVSIISFVGLRYYFVRNNNPTVLTNTDALINKVGVVTKTIEPHGTGRVRIKGEEWPAEAKDNVILHKGTYIHVTEVRGTKLVVK